MNIAELNFLNRQKIQKQLILPHAPTYIVHDKNQHQDVWYFTSQKYITLKKKKQNTNFGKFIRQVSNDNNQKLQKNDFISQTASNEIEVQNVLKDKQKISNSFEQNPSLIFLLKQSICYVKSKLRHIIMEHMLLTKNDSFKKQEMCKICEQIQKNEYNFILIDRKKLIDKIKQKRQRTYSKNQSENNAKMGQILNNLMQEIIILQKDKYNKNMCQIAETTFNPYFQSAISAEGFKFYVTRIESILQKKNYLVLNKNRKNYREQINSNKNQNDLSFLKELKSNPKNKINQDIANKTITPQNQVKIKQNILNKVSSVLWNTEFILFDSQKHAFNSDNAECKQRFQDFKQTFNTKSKIDNIKSHDKLKNSHMKQKISQKCDIIQKYLQNKFSTAFSHQIKSIQLDKKQILEENKVDKNKDEMNVYKVIVKQFRLWFMNNNMRNNHIYTLCVSDIKIQFIVDNRVYLGKFYQKIDLNKKNLLNNEIQSKAKYSLKEQDHIKIDFIEKMNDRTKMGIQRLRGECVNKNSISEIRKNNVNSKAQAGIRSCQQQRNIEYQNHKYMCECCFQSTEGQQRKQLRQSQYSKIEMSSKFIIKRHIRKLRQNLLVKLKQQFKLIDQQILSCSNNQPSSLDIPNQHRSLKDVQQQNKLIYRKQFIKYKIQIVTKLMEVERQSIIQEKTSTNITLLDKINSQTHQYDEAVVCQGCYQVFLSTIVNQKVKQNKSKSIKYTNISIKQDLTKNHNLKNQSFKNHSIYHSTSLYQDSQNYISKFDSSRNKNNKTIEKQNQQKFINKNNIYSKNQRRRVYSALINLENSHLRNNNLKNSLSIAQNSKSKKVSEYLNNQIQTSKKNAYWKTGQIKSKRQNGIQNMKTKDGSISSTKYTKQYETCENSGEYAFIKDPNIDKITSLNRKLPIPVKSINYTEKLQNLNKFIQNQKHLKQTSQKGITKQNNQNLIKENNWIKQKQYQKEHKTTNIDSLSSFQNTQNNFTQQKQVKCSLNIELNNIRLNDYRQIVNEYIVLPVAKNIFSYLESTHIVQSTKQNNIKTKKKTRLQRFQEEQQTNCTN